MSKIIIASGPVIVENGKVLLNQHGDDKFWKFCGGRVEDGEINLKKVAQREVAEEMGLKVEIIDQKPFFVYTEKEIDGQVMSVVLVHWLSKRLNEVSPGSDIKKWDWLSLEDLNQEDLAPNIKPTLKHFGFLS